MPTNISTPIWICDICRTSYDDAHHRAEHCESGGEPPRLPDGTPLLHRGNDGVFRLLPLTATDRLESAVRHYSTDKQARHFRRYTYPHPNGAEPYQSTDEHMSPLLAGHLQISSTQSNGYLAAFPHGSAAWASKVFGFGAAGSPVATGAELSTLGYDSSSRWVAPITDTVREVLTVLGAHLRRRRTVNPYQLQSDRINYALGVCGGNVNRANALLNHSNPDAVTATLNDLRERWFAGENVHAPMPMLDATSTRTPSKLTRELRALIDATGVPWAPRTDASEYVHTLVKETLMTTTRETTDLFPGVKVITVGGVKGGVGKSTTAAALAAALAHAGKQVVLLDFDFAGPSQHLLWNLGPVPVDAAGTRLRATPTDIDGLSVFSNGQVADGLPRRWTDTLAGQWVTFLGQTLDLGDADHVVIDLPAGLGVIDSIANGSDHTLRASVTVHVTTAHPLALEDTARGLTLDMHADQRQILVENMSRVTGTTAEGTSTEVHLFGGPGAVEELATTRGRLAYGGSLPWCTDHRDLARSAEMTTLALTVLDAPTR